MPRVSGLAPKISPLHKVGMPNYLKTANHLFKNNQQDGFDHLTGKLNVSHVRGETFVCVKDKSLNAPKSMLTKRALEEYPEYCEKCGTLPKIEPIPKVPKIMRTRPRILIKKNVDVRAIDGVKTANDLAYTGKFRKPHFFEAPPDPPKNQRNVSQIQLGAGMNGPGAAPLTSDIWMTSTQAAYNYTPHEYPAGFKSNAGIAAMYSTYAHRGVFSRDGIARRPVGLD